MLRLRPYKSCDAEKIAGWLKDEDIFLKWGGKLFGNYPITAEMVDDKYIKQNGGCTEPDNFYPWVALDDDGAVVGHFIMRYINGDKRCIRFGWVIVDDTIRGKGYGAQMLRAGLRYAFEILGAERVTLGVFEGNERAHKCYRSVGFVDYETRPGDPWNVIEMEIKNAKR